MYHRIVHRVPEDAELYHITTFSVAGIPAEIFVEIKPNLYTERAFGDYYHVVDGNLAQYEDAWEDLDIARSEMRWDEICFEIVAL